MRNLTVNGVTFQYPEVRDKNWGEQATEWATAVTAVCSHFFDAGVLPIADAGILRLASTDRINWRNAANTDNVGIFVDAASRLIYDDGVTQIDLTAAAAGNVTGPVGAIDDALARYDGATGQLIQDSSVILDDSANLTGINDLTVGNDLNALNVIATGDVDLQGTAQASAAAANSLRDATTRGSGVVAASGDVAISNSSGNFATSNSASFVAVPNLSVTLTTNGRPVMVMLQGALGGGSSYLRVVDVGNKAVGRIRLLRDAVSIDQSRLTAEADSASDNASVYVPPGSVQFVDVVGAGTYVYSVEVNVDAGDTIEIDDVRLVAYEL